MYTIEDLKAARDELRQWEERSDRYDGNNPDKYRSDIRLARSKVRLIEGHLKRAGQIALTEKEALEQALDHAFPNAMSKEVVEFEGRRYQRRFWPLEKSRSRKTVTEWGSDWVELPKK
ncbi:hypothetical protein H0I76_04760 [Limibaculum sp. M0105]|uniref:Uncharacterized protein n=1 Tax=Thermohalobaculum xanthum TaxID=2753746 RepID=A0A8J7M696_9RHOB|nr:hypothetical protein [Thermohalobaculum xanthum]MBK0398490.1 hypothetical protein [Thermohalobaculum xanthum]